MTETTLRILFLCDAGPTVGGGHVMRCLTLASALETLGATCAFVAAPEVTNLLDAFAPVMARIAPDAPTDAFDLIVFDHYRLAAEDHREIAGARPSVVIDDLADRPLHADLVIDSGPGRAADDYAGLVPAYARLLLGPAYAPVRPQFATARPATLARRLSPARPGRILVSLGLGDLNGITGRVLDILIHMVGETPVDAVLGSTAPSLSKARALALVYPWLTLHIDSRDMAGLTASADLAIGGGGSSSWERCVLGLPTLLLILADNQREAAAALESAGAVLALDATTPRTEFDGAFEEDVTRLLADAPLRVGMSLAAAEVCDGLGAERSARAVLALLKD